jgi:hypothetical protein
LIGSEKFELPFVINSHIFFPDEERSSVIFEHSRLSSLNKVLFERSIGLYSNLLKFIFKSENPKFKNKSRTMEIIEDYPHGINLDRKWYLESFLKQAIQSTFEYPVINSAGGEPIEIYKVIIP